MYAPEQYKCTKNINWVINGWKKNKLYGPEQYKCTLNINPISYG